MKLPLATVCCCARTRQKYHRAGAMKRALKFIGKNGRHGDGVNREGISIVCVGGEMKGIASSGNHSARNVLAAKAITREKVKLHGESTPRKK